MRHVTPAGLDDLEPLLRELRSVEGLVEKKRGVFYRRSRAFLHFHEDPTGYFADIRLNDEFERYPVTARADRVALMQKVRATLG